MYRVAFMNDSNGIELEMTHGDESIARRLFIKLLKIIDMRCGEQTAR